MSRKLVKIVSQPAYIPSICKETLAHQFKDLIGLLEMKGQPERGIRSKLEKLLIYHQSIQSLQKHKSIAGIF